MMNQDHIGRLVIRPNDQPELWPPDREVHLARTREHVLQLLAAQ